MTQALQPFGLYIHWPFCVSKCPYCDFNSHVAQTIEHSLWAEHFRSELLRAHAETRGRKVSSIFFGGGTPSLMNPNTVESIIETSDRLWGLRENCEITLEANPTTVEQNTFSDFKNAGVNRLSIGIQSFREDILKFLGRAHDQNQAISALELAQKSFDRYSFDLIYAYPDQVLADWQTDLNQALGYARGHLSLYQLTIEPGTEFHKDKVPAMESDRAADFYDVTQVVLDQAGLPAYEISNHAKNGQESRHNLIYWEGHDYLGLGPGAHSRLKLDDDFYAIHQIYKPELWMKAVQDKSSGEQKRKKINKEDRAIEILMMSLRLNKGLNLKQFEFQIGSQLDKFINMERVNDLIQEKLLIHENNSLRASSEGLKCLNGVLGHLIS